MPLRIGIVVGEVSGDKLAAQLISELQKQHRDLEVFGIIGPELATLGCNPLFPMEKLEVMGFIEPLLRLYSLIKIRRWLLKYFLAEPPDLFIGVDAPDFNLGLEKKLRAAGIPTVHYVSPTVWAWRQGRVKLIKQAVDLMLSIFPFEEDFFKKHNVPVKFIGHPAADQIPLETDGGGSKTIAILPGSRNSEIKNHAALYLATAKICYTRDPELLFTIPVVKEQHKKQIEELQEKIAPELPLTISVGQSGTVIEAADIVLVTSGTATLEVMLYKKPMVVAYKTNWITYQIIKRLIKVPYISQPNLIANKLLVKEFIQSDATKENLSDELSDLINCSVYRNAQVSTFAELHKKLRKNASITAAEAINELLGL